MIEREQAINAYDQALDEEQLVLLALRQPMASDLKYVIAFSRAVGELERVGDEAKKIARVVLADEGPPEAATVQEIGSLGARAETCCVAPCTPSTSSISTRRPAVIAADEDLDAQYLRGLEQLLIASRRGRAALPARGARRLRHEIAGARR